MRKHRLSPVRREATDRRIAERVRLNDRKHIRHIIFRETLCELHRQNNRIERLRLECFQSGQASDQPLVREKIIAFGIRHIMIASREVCQMFAHFLRCTWRQFFADDAIEFFFARDRMAGVPEITNVARRIHIVEIGKHRVPMFLCLLDVIDLAENEILEQIRRLKLFAARIQRKRLIT